MLSRAKGWILFSLSLLLLSWPLGQLLESTSRHQASEELLISLHEIAVLQLENLEREILASSAYQEDAAARALEKLKHSAYSAQYTHQRLRAGFLNELLPLESLEALLQVSLHLELSQSKGRAKDWQVLLSTKEQWASLLQHYRQLLSSKGSLVRSAEERVKRADQLLVKQLREKILE